jgi:hypothetical protein
MEIQISAVKATRIEKQWHDKWYTITEEVCCCVGEAAWKDRDLKVIGGDDQGFIDEVVEILIIGVMKIRLLWYNHQVHWWCMEWWCKE